LPPGYQKVRLRIDRASLVPSLDADEGWSRGVSESIAAPPRDPNDDDDLEDEDEDEEEDERQDEPAVIREPDE
jgi:hypothetical protein